MRLYLPILFCLAIGSQAQVGPQASQLPACIKDCDPAAIASVNCTNADQYCHCVRQSGIISNISTCAEKICESPGTSLYTFTALFGQVCASFNISVPVVGRNDTGNSTTSSSGIPTPSTRVYTGGAAHNSAELPAAIAKLVIAATLVLFFLL